MRDDMSVDFDIEEIKKYLDDISEFDPGDELTIDNIIKQFSETKNDTDYKFEQLLQSDQSAASPVQPQDSPVFKPLIDDTALKEEQILPQVTKELQVPIELMPDSVLESEPESEPEPKAESEPISELPEEAAEKFFKTSEFDAIKKERKTKSEGPFTKFVKAAEEDEDEEANKLYSPERSIEIDDYENREDRDDIYKDLKRMQFTVSFKSFLAGLTVVAAGLITMLRYLKFEGIGYLSALNHPRIYTAALLSLTLFITILCIGTMLESLNKIVTAKCSADTMTAFLAFSVIALDVMYILNPQIIDEFEYISFDFIYITIVFFNLSGKRMLMKNIRKNFSIIGSDEVKTIANFPKNQELTNDIIIETGIGGEIIYASKTVMVTDFISKSFADFEADRKIYHFNFMLMVAAVICTIGLFIFKHSLPLCIFFLAAVISTTVSVFQTLFFALPISKNGKATRKKTSVIMGHESAEEYADASLVIVEDTDVFNTVLHGIKVVGNEQIDTTIVNIAAIFNAAGGPLSSIFMQMIEHKNQMLPRVDDLYFHDTLGFSALIHSKIFLVGNKRLMEHFKIDIGDDELDAIYKKQSKHIMYAAYNGKLIAMFVLSYTLKDDAADMFYSSEREYLGIAIAQRDFNVNRRTLFNLYSPVDEGNFTILEYKTSSGCFKNLAARERADTGLVSLSGLSGLAYLLSASRKLAFSINANRIIKIISAFLSIPLMVFVLYFAPPSAQLPLHILAYQFIWALPMFLISLFSK